MMEVLALIQEHETPGRSWIPKVGHGFYHPSAHPVGHPGFPIRLGQTANIYRQAIIMIVRIQSLGQGHLFQIVQASQALGFGFRLSERGQKQCRQDGDDHEQFTEGEGKPNRSFPELRSPPSMKIPLWSPHIGNLTCCGFCLLESYFHGRNDRIMARQNHQRSANWLPHDFFIFTILSVVGFVKSWNW